MCTPFPLKTPKLLQETTTGNSSGAFRITPVFICSFTSQSGSRADHQRSSSFQVLMSKAPVSRLITAFGCSMTCSIFELLLMCVQGMHAILQLAAYTAPASAPTHAPVPPFGVFLITCDMSIHIACHGLHVGWIVTFNGVCNSCFCV